MKCDELKAIHQGSVELGDYYVYDAEEVDEAIAELNGENERLVKCCKEYDSRQRIDERIKFSYSQQLRATKRALWLARGYIMTLLQRDFQRLLCQCNNDGYKPNLARRRNKYYDLHEKCLKKAKEYK